VSHDPDGEFPKSEPVRLTTHDRLVALENRCDSIEQALIRFVEMGGERAPMPTEAGRAAVAGPAREQHHVHFDAYNHDMAAKEAEIDRLNAERVALSGRLADAQEECEHVRSTLTAQNTRLAGEVARARRAIEAAKAVAGLTKSVDADSPAMCALRNELALMPAD